MKRFPEQHALLREFFYRKLRSVKQNPSAKSKNPLEKIKRIGYSKQRLVATNDRDARISFDMADGLSGTGGD